MTPGLLYQLTRERQEHDRHVAEMHWLYARPAEDLLDVEVRPAGRRVRLASLLRLAVARLAATPSRIGGNQP